MKKTIAFLFAACISLAMPAHAQATYPSKPVRLMVGAGAGGGTDIIARMLAEKMAESLRVPSLLKTNPGPRTPLPRN